MKQSCKYRNVQRNTPTCVRWVVFFLLIGIFTACEKECNELEPVRTLIFYLGGDNNLSGEIAEKIECIKSAPLSPLCRVVIYEDTRGENPRLLELKMKNGKVEENLVRNFEEMNSASSETFADVLREVRERFPSPSYGLFLFSHASGWLPEGTYNNPSARATPIARSVVTDGKSEMELPDFAAAIPDGMFDFIIFEACHMAGIEVAWELKNKTHYIVASSAEIISPGFSPTYAVTLPQLSPYYENLVSFCRAIEADYRTRAGDEASLTLSLIDTKALDDLAATIQANTPLDTTTLHTGSGRSIQSFDRYNKNLFFDFGDYYASLLPDTQSEALQTAIENCVVWKTSTADFMPAYGGFEINSHSGLTTYISQEQYPNLNEAYKQLKWYKEVLAYERK